jgi:hypothetical protein
MLHQDGDQLLQIGGGDFPADTHCGFHGDLPLRAAARPTIRDGDMVFWVTKSK